MSGYLWSPDVVKSRRTCLDSLGRLSRHLLSKRAELPALPRHDLELLAHLRGRQLDKLRRGLRPQKLIDVVERGASVGTDSLDKPVIIVGRTLGGGLAGIFKQIDRFLAGYLGFRARVPRVLDPFFGHLTKCLRHFRVRQAEFWHLEFRHAVVREGKRGGGVFRGLGFIAGSGGFHAGLGRPPDAALNAGCW